MQDLKSDSQSIKFPELRKELLNLQNADQKEITENFEAIRKIKSEELRQKKYDQIAEHCRDRARRMLEILEEIKEPTVRNIGLDGSKAVSLLSLHSSLDVMKKVLKLYEDNFSKNRENIYYQAIPPLYDRIMIVEQRKQRFGTNWTVDKEGRPFLIEVDDFPGMNKRRAKYGLDPARRPVNLAVGAEKYPLGKGLAQEGDQKALTDEEYESYAEAYLKDV